MAWWHRNMENAHGGVLDRSVMTTEIVGRFFEEFSGDEVELLGYERKGVLLSELTDRRGWLQCASGARDADDGIRCGVAFSINKLTADPHEWWWWLVFEPHLSWG